MPSSDEWRRYAAPGAFLLAVTIAVILIRAGVESGGGSTGASSRVPPTTTHKVVDTTPTTTAKSHASAPAKKYWTVKAGDTFGVIASATGVSVATIEQLNPTIDSTSLFIGEKIRVK